MRLFAVPRSVAYQAPLSVEFPRQEYWSGLPFLSPGDLPNPGIEPRSPTGRHFTLWATREAHRDVDVRILLPGASYFKSISSVRSLSRVQLFATSWTAAHQASLSFTNSQSLLQLMCIESVMPSNHLIFCRPLLLLPSVFPSIRVFSSELALHLRWPKFWSFRFSISPSNGYSGLMSFRVDWLDLFAVQGTLKSLLQHHNSKASILQHSLPLRSNSHIRTWLLEKP